MLLLLEIEEAISKYYAILNCLVIIVNKLANDRLRLGTMLHIWLHRLGFPVQIRVEVCAQEFCTDGNIANALRILWICCDICTLSDIRVRVPPKSLIYTNAYLTIHQLHPKGR